MFNFACKHLVKKIGLTAIAALLIGWDSVPPAWASTGVVVQVERVPGINQKASRPVKLGTVHIAEDREMPETMLEGDFLECILPEGVMWNERTVVSFQKGATGEKVLYEEGEEYSFSGDRYLNISLAGVTEGRDILTIEPWVELDGFAGGKLNLSIRSDLLGPGMDESVSAGQCVNYGVTVENSTLAEGTAEEPFTATFILQETYEGSFHRGEDIEITLPEGFILADDSRFMTTKILSGSNNLFGTPQRKSDHVALLPVNRVSGEPVRVEITLRNLTAPEDFAGEVSVQAKGDVFEDTIVIANLEPIEKEETSSSLPLETVKHTSGIFWIDTASAVIEGTTVKLEAAPYIKQDRVYLPVRYVAYALGIDEDDIEWDADLESITLQKGEDTVQLKIGSQRMVVNGVVADMDVAPEITRGLTMLPARWVVEAFGGELEWNPEPPMVMIYTYEEN